jgi:hypothetical protein
MVKWMDGWEGIGTSRIEKNKRLKQRTFPIGSALFSNGSNRRWRRLATATFILILLFRCTAFLFSFFPLIVLACQRL